MSKSDGWEKHKNCYEWNKRGDTFRAQIDRATGGYSPYYWDVYPLPRSAGTVNGRYIPVAKGSSQTLADAKAQAQSAIDLHIQGDDA